MRISDWSSDVCSSDLDVVALVAPDVVLAVAAVDAVVAGAAEQELGVDRVRIVDRLVRPHGAAARTAVDHVVAGAAIDLVATLAAGERDRKSPRLNSSH